MLELAKAICTGADLREVKGITFKEDGLIMVTPGRPFTRDLDRLPFPDELKQELSVT